MNGKKVISICLLLSILLCTISCQKTVDSSAADIAALKESVSALQKTTDSLAKALAASNNNVASLSSKVDSIKAQIVIVQNQITVLNSQLTITNTNITAINVQIVILNQQYTALLAQLNAILAQLSITPNSLSSGLLAWLPFSNNAIDSSGNGNDGTIIGATTTANRFGQSNTAFSFDGISNFISLKNNNLCSATTDVSISVWVNIKNWTNNGGYLQASIIEEGSIQHYYHLQIGPQNQPDLTKSSINFQFNNIAFSTLLNNPIHLNQWYNIVFTNSNKIGKIYLNGNLLIEYAGYPYGNSGCPLNLNLGKEKTWFYNGAIDDLRIYNRALTEQEITYLATH